MKCVNPGLEPRSQKAWAFCADLLYNKSYDFAVKQAVRHQQSLEELLDHAMIEKVWKQCVHPEQLAATHSEVDHEVGGASAHLANLLPTESVSKLSQPENAQKLEAVESAADGARKQVRSQIQTIDGSMSLEKLAKQMRNMDVCKLRGNDESSIMILYVLDAAGEHEKDPRRSPTPMRRDFMEKILKAVMSTRGPLPDFEQEKIMYPQLHPSDMSLGTVLGQIMSCFSTCYYS
eukprot:Skav208140  [mRNA]  locus=scaffold235:3653:4351:+ [translate_table: standard]